MVFVLVMLLMVILMLGLAIVREQARSSSRRPLAVPVDVRRSRR